MENDKSTITKELDHIRNRINQKNDTESDDNDFILLDKIPFVDSIISDI